MNILDINNLPTITMKISGREGIASGAWVINQEKKHKIEIEAGELNYVAGSELQIALTDSSFISSIEEDTTLSVIVFSGLIPLYRDIVKFKGELDSVSFYSQYNHSGDYYVFGEEEDSVDEESGDVDSGGDTGGGYTPPDTAGNLVISDFATKFDLNNNGLGELKLSSSTLSYTQNTKDVLGDFKVRTGEYGTFESTPTSLEEVVVYSVNFDVNNGNGSGWDPRFSANTPELEGPHYHFAGGQSEQTSDRIAELIALGEVGSEPIGDASVFKEDSLSDWTVGMSLYKDAAGTPIMDGRTSNWDRYHFLSKTTAGDWTLIRSTDNIVTHVEVVKDTDYLKFIELYKVSIVSSPYASAPTDWADYLVYFNDQMTNGTSTTSIVTSGSGDRSVTKRRVLDYSNGTLIATGDNILQREYNKNSGVVFNENLIGIPIDTESEGTIYQYTQIVLSKDNLNFLIVRIDNSTGLVNDFQWYPAT